MQSLIPILSVTAFALDDTSVLATETMRLAKPEIFTIWLFPEKGLLNSELDIRQSKWNNSKL